MSGKRRVTAVDRLARKKLAELLDKHSGSYKAAAIELGLGDKGRAGIYSVVKRGSRSKAVYTALGLPYRTADNVTLCPCGRLHDRDCTEGKKITRLAKVSGRVIPLTPEAAKRLGIKGNSIPADRLLSFIQSTAVPFLAEREAVTSYNPPGQVYGAGGKPVRVNS